MEAKLYYTPPSDEAFEELKNVAISVWQQYENEDYRNEKVGKIKDIQNISDNFMFIFAMFSIDNQRLIGMLLKEETRQAIRERLIDGGQPDWAMPF